MSKAYEKAGVSLKKGYEVVKRIKKHIDRTKIKGVVGDIGAFGGLFDISILDIKNPILVSGTDGVGTKLLLAQEMNRDDTIGEDLVAMSVNDVLVQGAKPLYFLDYIAMGKNDPDKIEKIVSGISNGCVLGECALIGGETAEMPGVYSENDYDLAGFAVGIVEKEKLITGEKIEEGDILIGLRSSGIHSNGYSLVRKIIKDRGLELNRIYPNFNEKLGDILLKPTRIYSEIVRKVLDDVEIKGMVHVTGGGFYENIPRVFPKGLRASIDLSNYKIPEIFKFLQEMGDIELKEMINVFNMGIGYIFILSQKDREKMENILKREGEEYIYIGKVEKGDRIEIKW